MQELNQTWPSITYRDKHDQMIAMRQELNQVLYIYYLIHLTMTYEISDITISSLLTKNPGASGLNDLSKITQLDSGGD